VSLVKAKALIKDLLVQGMSPRKIAVTVALGVALGMFPVLGVTTILCAAVALIFRLNQVVIQGANYAVYPIQILLLGGFYALGSQWFGDGGVASSFTGLATLLKNDIWGGLVALTSLTLHAAAAWLIVALPLAAVVYLLTAVIATRVEGLLVQRRLSKSTPFH
jgi:uncharacterized protein (DUF2062 family)